MKIQSTREIWTLKTGKQIELISEEIEEIALHFAPMVDVDLPSDHDSPPNTYTMTTGDTLRGFPVQSIRTDPTPPQPDGSQV